VQVEILRRFRLKIISEKANVIMKKLFLKLLTFLFYTIILLIIFFIVGINLPIENFEQKSAKVSKLYLKNAKIIDIKNAKIIDNQSITIDNGRIIKIDSTDESPTGFQVIDIKNKYVMPTLWDMHVHTLSLSPQLHFPLMIANGVTNIRDMGDGDSWISGLEEPFKKDKLIWEEKATKEELLMPKIWESCSYHVEELEDISPKDLVSQLKARNEPFIKLQLEDSGLSAKTFYELQNEAKKQQINILGHLSYNVNIDTVLQNSYRSIEHAWALIPHFVKQKKRFEKDLETKEYELKNQDLALTNSVLQKIAAANTFYCPTNITSNRKEALAFDRNFLDNPHNQYIERVQLKFWGLWASIHTSGYDKPEQQVILKNYYQKGLEITGLAHKNGVKILAGTDALDRYVYHGFSLHDELIELTKAGLSNAEALKTATVTPAEYYQVTADYGSVEVGKVADLLILEKNPLEDISHTKSIDAVYFNQKFYKKQDLESMKNYVREQAKSFSISCKFLWNMLKGMF
jgi:hypothetical protein